MAHVNIGDPSFVHDPSHPEGFRAGIWRLEALQLGPTVRGLPPGQAICPYRREDD